MSFLDRPQINQKSFEFFSSRECFDWLSAVSICLREFPNCTYILSAFY